MAPSTVPRGCVERNLGQGSRLLRREASSGDGGTQRGWLCRGAAYVPSLGVGVAWRAELFSNLEMEKRPCSKPS